MKLTVFHDGLYWAAVTVATVGYGDIHPETTQGKFVVVFTILLVATIVPQQTNELISLLARRSYYERAAYVSHKAGRHIVMAGSITAVAFMDFVEEFYHRDHGFEDSDIVLLSPWPLERDLESRIRCDDRLTYIQGSPMNRKA